MGGHRAARWPAMLAVVVATFAPAVAGARPRRAPHDVLADELQSPFGERSIPPPQPCESGAWPKLKKCLEQGGSSVVDVLYDLPGAKLLSMHGKATVDFRSVTLYMLRDKKWRRMSMSASINPSTEILSFTRLEKATGYRLIQGVVMRTSGALDQQTRVPVILRRQLTTICFDNGSCQSAYTDCDALVEGKTYWTFHGALSVDHGVLRLSGDKSLAGMVCAPPTSTFSPDPLGDLLE